MDGLKPEVWVAIYAAIVATAALLLNLRTWLEGRPRLHLSIMVDAMLIGGAPQTDEKGLIALTVTNRGKTATVITHMVLLQMNSWWERWFIRPRWSAIIAHPYPLGSPPNIPSDLEPAKKWNGFMRPLLDLTPRLYDGTFYVGVYASHRDRPYLKRVRRKVPKPVREAKKLD